MYDSYQETAIARNLVNNDQQWRKCLNDACLTEMPHRLRSLFALICVHNTPVLPTAKDLWEQFKDCMSDDFIRNGKNTQEAYNLTLQVI